MAVPFLEQFAVVSQLTIIQSEVYTASRVRGPLEFVKKS